MKSESSLKPVPSAEAFPLLYAVQTEKPLRDVDVVGACGGLHVFEGRGYKCWGRLCE